MVNDLSLFVVVFFLQFPRVQRIAWLVASKGIKYTTVGFDVKNLKCFSCLECEFNVPTNNNVKPQKDGEGRNDCL